MYAYHLCTVYIPSEVNVKTVDWNTGSVKVVVLEAADIECL